MNTKPEAPLYWLALLVILGLLLSLASWALGQDTWTLEEWFQQTDEIAMDWVRPYALSEFQRTLAYRDGTRLFFRPAG